MQKSTFKNLLANIIHIYIYLLGLVPNSTPARRQFRGQFLVIIYSRNKLKYLQIM